MQSGSDTRLTCQPCRERKVKCDRVFPDCSRCSRLGVQCTYRERISYRAKQATVIQQLQERVNQAEAHLALRECPTLTGHDMVRGVPPVAPSVGDFMPMTRIPPAHVSPGISLSVVGTGSPGIPMSTSPGAFEVGEASALEKDFRTVEVFDQSTSLLGEPTRQTEYNQVNRESVDILDQSLSTDSHVGITGQDLNQLHQIFFHEFDIVLPIVYKDRFLRELRDSPYDLAINSVSYTIALLAITVSTQHRHLEHACYALARDSIDACEGDDRGDGLTSISFMQALLLLTRYEIARRRCARGWLTLGRAIRLAKMMRLEETDSLANHGHQRGASDTSGSLLQTEIRASNDVVEREEQRRCLWALYVFEGYNAIHMGTLGSMDDTALFVSLPSPGRLDNDFEAEAMPFLGDATSLMGDSRNKMSPFAGAVLTVSFLRRVLRHTDAKRRDAGPGFWDRHYGLLKMAGEYGALLRPLTTMQVLHSDALAFNVYLTFCGVELLLWEAAVDEGEKDGLQSVLKAESTKQLVASALKIATAVQRTWATQRLACDNLSMSGAFVAWPLSMAIRALNRQVLLDDRGDRASLIQMLQTLLDEVDAPRERGPWLGVAPSMQGTG